LGEAPRSTDPWHAEAVARWPGHGPADPRGWPAPSWRASTPSFSGGGMDSCWVGISRAPALKIDRSTALALV
jgi:hypothetical protein